MSVEQASFHMLSKVVMDRKDFEATPDFFRVTDNDGRSYGRRKVLIGDCWYVVDQEKSDERVVFVHPIEFGTFLRED